jgi:hypothetical protein
MRVHGDLGRCGHRPGQASSAAQGRRSRVQAAAAVRVAGDAERAIFALERVLAVQPDNLQARAEIARAYMRTGEREAAKREFQAVRARRVPEEVRATIDGFLSAIAAAERTQVARYVEVGLGYDTNVNSATPSSSIAIPAIGPNFQLASSLTEQDDRFLSLSGGINFTRKLNLSWAVVGNFGGVVRQNLTEGAFNTDTIDGSLGIQYRRGLNAVTVGLQGQYFGVDANSYRNTGGLIAQWQHNYDERTQSSLFVQHAALRYETQPVRDADRSILGVAYAKVFSGEYSPAIFFSVYGGQEKEVDSAFPHLGHEPVGARFGTQFRLGGGWSAYGSLFYERREYRGIDPLFLIVREDKQAEVRVGTSYLWRSGTTLRLELAHTANDSNIVLNDYDRTVVTLATRFNF